MTEIYLDSAATSLHKPPQVARAVAEAICTAGNAARGAHGASMAASRTVYDTRCLVARLLGCPRPDHVAFTANSTMALNMAICGLLTPEDHAISTDLEHNSVLRPLYALQRQGMGLSFLPADGNGRLDYDALEGLFPPTAGAKSIMMTLKSCCGPTPGPWCAPTPPTSPAICRISPASPPWPMPMGPS